MLRYVLFDMELFKNESDRANSQKRILWLLEALTRCNQLYLQQNPNTPLIYQSGIKYIVPEQFEKANTPEVDVVRQYLAKKGAPGDVKKALEAISDLVGGGEHFREIPRIIEHGGGDCFPTGTRMLKRDGSFAFVETLSTGDEIWGRHRWSKVTAVWKKADSLPTRQVCIAENNPFYVTDDHKLFVIADGGALVRVAAAEVTSGMRLIAPKSPREVMSAFDEMDEYRFSPFDASKDAVRTVLWNERFNMSEVWDLTTDDHYVYLPDADVTVSQCDNVASWRAAELRELGVNAKPYITWRQRPDGGYTYHVIVMLPDGSSEDPSLLLGMGGISRDADRKEEERKLGERMGDLLSGNLASTFGTGRSF